MSPECAGAAADRLHLSQPAMATLERTFTLQCNDVIASAIIPRPDRADQGDRAQGQLIGRGADHCCGCAVGPATHPQLIVMRPGMRLVR